MQKANQHGSTSVIVAILMTILFIAAASFGGWAYKEMQDYKNNSDQKSAVAVAAAEKAQETELRKEFAEDYKKPNKVYKSASVLGTITFAYPKTWSAYVNSSGSSQALNGYFHPDVVPGVESKTAYALRLELVSQEYSVVLTSYENNIKQGFLKARAFLPPKMKKIGGIQTGTFMTGIVSPSSSGSDSRQGALLVIPVRDKTLKIYTEAPSFLKDFNKIVIPSLAFKP